MRLSGNLGSRKVIRIAVGATAFIVTLVTLTPASAAPGSWSNQPSWSSGSSTPNESSSSRRAPRREIAQANTSPFAPGSNNVALHIGQVFLMGDLSAKYTDSIGGQVHYTYGVSDMFGFNASIGHSSHSNDKEQEFSMTTLLAGLRTNLSWYDKVVPYGLFGLGFYKPSYQVTVTNSLSPVVFGVHLGLGVDLQLTNQLFFGAGLTFHDMFGTTRMTAAGPVDVGGTFTSFLLHAGVSF